jgi:bacterioferritin
VVECLGADLQLEYGGRETLVAGVAQCEAAADFVSRDLLMRILSDTEEHIDFLENQFKLIEMMGEPNYIQSAMSEIAPDKGATGN